ncbi:MAG: endolytic transglycosylase MltG [Chlorobi bacterium]|nr:endolytic transglycosylase MltG [Chlorobiota bacterium]MCI0715644.1 endolytic transglycosylase MltG [Chlorobiota bacterium]
MTERYFYPPAFVITFAVFFLLQVGLLNRNYRNIGDDAVIKIIKGDNLRSVATKLEESEVIFNKYILIALGRVFGYQVNLIPGEYKLENGLTYLVILKTLTDPSVMRSVTITIPEGLNIKQIARLLHRQIGVDSARFVEEGKNDSLIKMLDIEADNLEGFLFPDTYRISIGGNINIEREIVSILANEFRKKINMEIKEEMEKQNLSLNELITIASIIEGETRYDEEKKTIAGVYYNRLKRGIKLEADPTVQYSLPDGPKKRLKFSDLKYPSPYNTYLNKGLPPGPINNPGLSSILAALDPEEHNYLYFVAKGDGSHRFAETYDEHKKNIELYKQFIQNQEIEK